MSKSLALHSVEIGHLLNEMSRCGIESCQFDEETQQFIHSIRGDEPVSHLVMQRNLENILLSMPDNGQGLRAGEKVQISDAGAFSHAILSSRNLRSAYQLILNYRNVLRLIHEVSVTYSSTHFVHAVENLKAEGKSARFFVECFLSEMFQLFQVLLGPDAVFLSVDVTYEPPEYATTYEAYFRCPVRFGQERNQYTASAELLDRKFSFANEDVKQFCEQQCQQMLREMEAGSETVNRAREALLRKPGWFPPCDELARELGFAPRTFRRRLQEENNNYQSVIESVRKELSANYLRTTDMTVELIAYRLGYEQANSFYKAFRRWYGTSPKAFSELN